MFASCRVTRVNSVEATLPVRGASGSAASSNACASPAELDAAVAAAAYAPRAAPSGRFSGKVVLVTGGTTGNGLATAIAALADGAAAVAVCGRTPAKFEGFAKPVCAALGVDTARLHYTKCDVRVEAQVRALVESVFARFGRLDVAVNNAGVAAGAPTTSQPLTSHTGPNGSIAVSLGTPQPGSACANSASDPFVPSTPSRGRACPGACNSPAACETGTGDFATQFCENPLFTIAIGMFYCVKWELRYMRGMEHPYGNPKTSPGCIVNVASINAFIASPGAPFYTMAKAAVVGLTKTAAVEQSPGGGIISPTLLPIRVNAVAPGPVNTPLMWAQAPAQSSTGAGLVDWLSSVGKAPGNPMQRLAQPSEIAQAILYLGDDAAASYVTGSTLVVDGGILASG